MTSGEASPQTGFDVQTTERTILLVDDEENILSALRRLLRRDGYRILTAGSGAAGLEVLAAEAVDVIVSDQRMPNMTGTEFLKKAREGWPHTVRIVLSGYTDLASVTEAINDGAAYKFLTKPWDDEILRLAIREAFVHKWVQDENRMLHKMLVDINTELAEANRRLSEQTAVATEALQSTQEMLYHLPLPVLGITHEGLLMLANRSALALLDLEGKPGLGMPLTASLPLALQQALSTPEEEPLAPIRLLDRDWLIQRARLPGLKRGEVIALVACEAPRS